MTGPSREQVPPADLSGQPSDPVGNALADVDEQARFDRVSDGLRSAFAALASPQLPDADKPDWHRRLIAITNSSKHDLATAEGRLDRWWADYEQQVGPRP